MLRFESIEPATLGLLKCLQSQPEFAGMSLVGGTALALYLGHRLSIDLDFFGNCEPAPELLQVLERCGSVRVIHRTNVVRVFEIDGVKVDIVTLNTKKLAQDTVVDGLRLASIQDIAAMKMEAITNRGSRKDFVDISFLLQTFDVESLLELYQRKFTNTTRYHVLRSLVYFDDAEAEPMPKMLLPFDWEVAKGEIQRAVRALALSS